jgi:hypothetical protein
LPMPVPAPVTSATFCNSAIVRPSANQAIIVMAYAWRQCG